MNASNLAIVQNSSSPFLAPWGGFLPCQTRVNCQLDVPLWHPYKALCEPLAGYPSLPGFYGYCRCSTWLFRHGKLCENNANTHLLYTALESALVMAAVALNTVLVSMVWSKHRMRYSGVSEAFLNTNSAVICICGISVLASFLGIVVEIWVSFVIPFQSDLESMHNLDWSLNWWSITVFPQVPVYAIILGYTLVTHQFFVIAQRWLQGARTSTFNPMLLCSSTLAVVSAVLWTYVSVAGRYSNLVLLYIILATSLAGYFVYVVNKVVVILSRYPNLDKWKATLTCRLKGLIAFNVLAIVFMLIALGGAIQPKTLSSTELDFGSFAEMFARSAFLIPIAGLLYFLLGVYSFAAAESSTSQGSQDKNAFESLFQSAAEQINDPSFSITRVTHTRPRQQLNSEVTHRKRTISDPESRMEDHIVTVC